MNQKNAEADVQDDHSREREKDFSGLTIGVLGVQGAVMEHMQAVEQCGARALFIRNPSLLSELDGLILPGGESTTIGRLIKRYNYEKGINDLAKAGKPLWGTCAGMVLLAQEVENQEALLGLMSITVRRNAFGRQRESFEADLDVPALGNGPFRGVFIRAPIILSSEEGVHVLARFKDYIVAARQDHFMVSSFHPELTSDLRFHQYFLQAALTAHSI